ncbi:MAG: DNA recombination protein RmuC, partial [Rikenellaceae bacterium]
MDISIVILLVIIILFSGAVVFLVRSYHSRIDRYINNEIELQQNILNQQNVIGSLRESLSAKEQQIKSFYEREQLMERNRTEREAQLKNVFENVAQKILEQKSDKFLASSSLEVGKLLEPLSKELSEFGKRVDAQFTEHTKDSASLKSELSKLMELNHKLGVEAESLVKAIKGEHNPKFQGDWGEMILEKILVNSGLVRGEHYFPQESSRSTDGDILRPDIVIRYPDAREVIIDSKVSLTAYVRYSSAATVEEADVALKEHIASVKRHIDSLSSKRYDYKEESLDFVMMFMAVEPAYMLALTADADLWEYAYKKKILLVSPTHLITALKLVYDLWSRDAQNKNAIEIAARGALMLDKFAGFVADMENINKNIDLTRRSYDTAMN